MNNIDSITEIFMQTAVEDGNPENVVKIVGKLQELMVSMFTLYIIMTAKEHEDHDCEVFKEIPDAIAKFKTQLLKDLDMHIAGNMAVNGITLVKTQNQKTYDEIMAKLNQAE